MRHLYLNLHIKNLKRSVDFFTELGFTFKSEFTNENTTCMVISDTILVMLLEEPIFKSFTPKEVCDTTKFSEVLITVQVESRNEVDRIVKLALMMGALGVRDPQDYGFMYGHSFQDLDGHIWEFIAMEEVKQ